MPLLQSATCRLAVKYEPVHSIDWSEIDGRCRSAGKVSTNLSIILRVLGRIRRSLGALGPVAQGGKVSSSEKCEGLVKDPPLSQVCPPQFSGEGKLQGEETVGGRKTFSLTI